MRFQQLGRLFTCLSVNVNIRRQMGRDGTGRSESTALLLRTLSSAFFIRESSIHMFFHVLWFVTIHVTIAGSFKKNVSHWHYVSRSLAYIVHFYGANIWYVCLSVDIPEHIPP